MTIDVGVFGRDGIGRWPLEIFFNLTFQVLIVTVIIPLVELVNYVSPRSGQYRFLDLALRGFVILS